MDSYEEMRRKEAEIEKMLEELSEAAYYEGTEVADTWMLLKETYEHLISDYVSDEFAMALEKVFSVRFWVSALFGRLDG
jgi:hypothetical protein